MFGLITRRRAKELVRAASRTAFKTGLKRAYYAGAKTSSIFSGWTTSNQSGDSELRSDLAYLRSRARELVRNASFAKKFVRMCQKNIVGPSGIQFQSRVMNSNNNPDILAIDRIETAFREWCRKGNCEVTGEYSFRDIQNILAGQTPMDGEVFIRKIFGYPNKFGFALQLIEADHLDEKYTTRAKSGNEIKMGIEYDNLGRKVAYHLYKTHPGDYFYTDYRYGERVRIPANEMIHYYIKNRISQGRGVTWLHPVMVDSNMLNGYFEAELVASRAASQMMGFIESDKGDAFQGDDTEDGNPIMELEAGTVRYLGDGEKFTGYNPDHPTTAFGPFVEGILKQIASGLDVSYNYLANDLKSVNYSSIRAGVLDERDTWRDLQAHMTEHFCVPVFNEFLKYALIYKAIDLPYSKYDKFITHNWQPRGWQWVDPLKEQNANANAVESGFMAPSEVVAASGRDYEDVIKKIKQDGEIRKKYGISTKFDKTEIAPGVTK